MATHVHKPTGGGKDYTRSSYYKKRVNVENEYFSRTEVAKIFGVGSFTVKKWEKEGIIVRTFLPSKIAYYHQRELGKIADTIYSDTYTEETKTCTCRCKSHRPNSPLDLLKVKVEKDRAEERALLRPYIVNNEEEAS